MSTKDIPEDELNDFKSKVKVWLECDNNIAKLTRAMKEQKEKKEKLTKPVLDFMKKYDVKQLSTDDGKLKYSTTMIAAPLNKEYVSTKLSNILHNQDKAKEITQMLFDSREKKEKVALKRTIDKDPKL